jgi:hypothetical protein
MKTVLKETKPKLEKREDQLDDALEDTFPASDPPATGGVTKLQETKPSDVPPQHSKR